MIHGIGVDLVRVARIEASLQRFGERLVARILHEAEQPRFRAARVPAAHLAKAFAAKEAFAKALGTGIRGFAFHDLGVVRDEQGRPSLVFAPPLQEALQRQQIRASHVSLSDEDGFALAMVILERG